MTRFLQDVAIRWLRKAERVTHTDNVYLAKNVFVLGGAHVIAVLNGFVIYILIARFVNPVLFGEYKYLVSLFELSAITSLTGMKIAITRSIANGYDGSLVAAFWYRLRRGYVFGIIVLCMALWYGLHGAISLMVTCGFIYAISPLVYGASSYAPFLQGKKRFTDLARITLINEILLLCGMIVGIMWAQSALMLFVIFLFVTGGPMLVWYRFATRQVTNTAVDPALIPHGTHQSWIDILGVVSSRIDSILVFHYLGAFEVATYAFAVLTAEQLKSFTASTFTIAGPKFAKNDLVHTLKSFGRKMLLMSLIGLMMSMAYYMVAPWMYRWFFPNYIGALSYSRVYAFSLIGMLPALLGNYLFNIKGLRRETTVVSLVNNAVLIGSVCIGGYMYGMWGIIYSRLFSSVFQCATIIWFVRSLRAREHVSHV